MCNYKILGKKINEMKLESYFSGGAVSGNKFVNSSIKWL